MKMKTTNKNLNGTYKNKAKFAIIFLIFAFNLLAVNALAADGMICGTVSDLERIFTANETTASGGPPVDYLVSKAGYGIKVVDGYAEVSADYDVEALKDGWIKIKMFSGDYALKKAQLDGSDVSFISESNVNYLLLNNKKGKHKLEVDILIRINEGNFGPNSRYIKLGDLPEAPISTLRLEIPETEIGVEIEPTFSTEIKEYPNKTITAATLVSGGGISVIWHPKKEEIIIEKLPAKVYASVNSLISVGEGVMKCRSVIDYSIAQGAAGQFRIQMPSGVSILEVSDLYGNPLKEYKTDKNNIILIQTPYDVKNSYGITLRYEKDMGGTSAVSDVPEIKVLDVERETGYFGVEARTNVEITVAESSGAARIDVNELPQDIWAQSQNPLLYGYKYLKHPYSVTLDVKKHEDVPVLSAAVDYAEIITLLTEDKKSITKATYQVKNNRKQFLEVTLPQGSEIWSAFVSNSPVKPAKNDEGKILIPLTRSQGYEGSLYSFPVEIVYITNTSEFGMFGSNNYEIPAVDIPVSRVNLLLYLPENYDFIKFEGDLKKVDYFGGYAVERGGDGMSNYGTGASRVPVPAMPVPPQIGIGTNVNDEKANVESITLDLKAAMEKGVLPVRINIPENGKAYSFTKLLAVEDKKLNVSATYIESGAYAWIGRIVLLFILFIGFYAVRNLRNLRGQLIKILLIIIVPLIISYFLSGVWYYITFGWMIVVVAAVIYGLYTLVKGYLNKSGKTKNENETK